VQELMVLLEVVTAITSIKAITGIISITTDKLPLLRTF
jgi:hypothetical protein